MIEVERNFIYFVFPRLMTLILAPSHQRPPENGLKE